MEREAKGKTFKMKGHTLPGINQKSEGNTDLADGRSKSSAFQLGLVDNTRSAFGGGDATQAMQQPNPLPNVGAGVDPSLAPPIVSKPSIAKDYKEGFEAYPSMRKIKK